jgi:hypothetical protein
VRSLGSAPLFAIDGGWSFMRERASKAQHFKHAESVEASLEPAVQTKTDELGPLLPLALALELR